MKRSLLTSLLITGSLVAGYSQDRQKIADAIYRAEGGARARVPYGILSVPVHGAAEARQVCLRTIDTNRARWTAAGSPGDFIDFLGNVYCPPSADPTGNRNWRHNVKAIVKQNP